MSELPQHDQSENTVKVSEDELKKLADAIEEVTEGQDKGRKKWCCRYQDGRTHTVKGWTHVDAMAACMAHRPGVSVSVSKGSC